MSKPNTPKLSSALRDDLQIDTVDSPMVATRSIHAYGHGSSVPARAGVHEDHHRSNSGADLGIDEETRARLCQRAEAAAAAEAASRRLCPAPQHNSGTPRNNGSGTPRTNPATPAAAYSTPRDGERPRRLSDPKDYGDSSVETSASNSPSGKTSRSRSGSLKKSGEMTSAAAAAASAGAEGNTGRLLIVANRLPLSMSIKRKTDVEDDQSTSQITFSNSSGGLVSALSGCDMESRWIGWPGAEVRRAADREVVSRKLEELKCVPVFLTQKVCDLFYNEFCNSLLWPLFHYIPLPVEAITTADAQFDAYKQANEAFAEAVLECYEDGDIVWVHDYHLMLLPHMLRTKKPNMKIGFFFHTPFPAFEIYRMLPARSALLDGVLAANLIGFHTHDYSRHFQKSCIRILGVKGAHEALLVNDSHTARLGTFPIGIDPNKFLKTLAQSNMEAIIAEYKREFKGRKVLLGIDRLDYIKGIQHKLYAFEMLLEKYPDMRNQCVFVQIAVPSRTDVTEYQQLKRSTHELVGRVNGIYGGVGHAPIHYLDQSIPFDRMCALYRVADAMVITSVRDGMNLVAYEYIACQQEQPGTLILSEFAGAAQSLGDAPLLVNPWSVSECCAALHKAITMPLAERSRRQESMFRYVIHQTAQRWARDYIRALLTCTNTPLSWLKEVHTEGDELAEVTSNTHHRVAKNNGGAKSASVTLSFKYGKEASPVASKDLFVRQSSMLNMGQLQ